MKPSSSSALAVAVAVLAVAAEATIESTCQEAAARDRRVDVRFCAREFTAYHGADEADPWGLAKAAALIGVNLGDDAVYDIGSGKVRPPRGAGGRRARDAMAACAEAYDAAGTAFAEASDELGARRYAAARQELARVAALVQRCDGGLARAGARTPRALARYSNECQQMAIIGIAITDLIK